MLSLVDITLAGNRPPDVFILHIIESDGLLYPALALIKGVSLGKAQITMDLWDLDIGHRLLGLQTRYLSLGFLLMMLCWLTT